MVIEKFIRYVDLAVGLKPSAIQGDARLRRRERTGEQFSDTLWNSTRDIPGILPSRTGYRTGYASSGVPTRRLPRLTGIRSRAARTPGSIPHSSLICVATLRQKQRSHPPDGR